MMPPRLLTNLTVNTYNNSLCTIDPYMRDEFSKNKIINDSKNAV